MKRKRYQVMRNRINRMTEQELLDTRICDLGLSIEGSMLEPHVERLYSELVSRGFSFRPHCWLSDDWFSPDGIPGIAIPFYLAHPRLMKLERKQMVEVEGGTRPWLMRILRHEAGHAIDTAFRLHRRRSYREIFGNYFAPYPDSYRPRPRSKAYVLHLEPWYAQSHPAEDFAETFAVWMAPGQKWREDYRGWKALAKLEFVAELMEEIAGQPTRVRSRIRIEPVSKIRRTLREHYSLLHERFQIDCSADGFDGYLRKLFSRHQRDRDDTQASLFLLRHRSEVCKVVSQFTGENPYNINQIISQMATRADNLGLFTHGDSAILKSRLVAMMTTITMNVLSSNDRRIAL